MFRNLIIKYRYLVLFTIGLLLIILSFGLLLYDRYEFIKSEVFADISLKKYNESQLNNSDISGDTGIENEDSNQNIDVDTDYIVDEDAGDSENNNDNSDNDNNNSNNNSLNIPEKDCIGFLQINKINLNVGLASKNSYYNNVNRNVEVLKVGDYPDVLNGNFILASHSGTSKVSYFRYLYKLSLNDIALVYYNDYIYHYKIVDIYNVPKVGSLEIKRNPNKTVMTLITCTKNSKTEQTVYILELFSKTRNGENDD